jgi:hypothetical protein
MFGQREKFFPVGFGRHFGGESATDSFLEMVRRFDGRNESEDHPARERDHPRLP